MLSKPNAMKRKITSSKLFREFETLIIKREIINRNQNLVSLKHHLKFSPFIPALYGPPQQEITNVWAY